MNEEVKQQLMSLAGIQDEKEFEVFLRQTAAQYATTQEVGKAAPGKSPFQLHFVQIMNLIESKGMDKFLALGDDSAAQIQFVYDAVQADSQYKDVEHLVTQDKDAPLTDQQAAEKSKGLRDLGNKAYSKKDFSTAIAEYCASITTGPLDQHGKGRDVALSMGNRSAVFYEQGLYSDCLADIESAFYFGYPKELHYKLFDRQARCYMEMHKEAKAGQCFLKAFKAIDYSNLKENRKKTMKEDLTPIIKDVKATPEEDPGNGIIDGLPECPFKIWESNPQFPPLADCLDIVYNDQVGRHVITKQNIQAGDVIVIEDPIAAHLSPYKMPHNCSHCFRVLGRRMIPSTKSRKARFCCLNCLKTAVSSYHGHECAVDITRIFYGDDVESQLSGCISLALRAVTQKSVDFFIENRKELFTEHDIRFGTEKNDSQKAYVGDQHYKGLYNLVTHEDRNGTTETLTFLIRTVVLLQCLKKSNYFSKDQLSKEGNPLTDAELYIAQLLLHFQKGIQYNLHTVYQVNGELEATKKLPLEDIGSGVYPTTLFFNHSCCPNTVRVNQGPRVIFVAKCNIRAGEEVTDCYGIHHLSIDKPGRKKALDKGYAFSCQCIACKKNYPLLGDLPAKLTPKITVALGTLLSKYQSAFQEGNLVKAAKKCAEYINKLGDSGVKIPHKNYEIAAIALCNCMWGRVKDL